MELTLTQMSEEINSLLSRQQNLIKKALDGRTQRWLSKETGISEYRLSICINGMSAFKKEEIRAINKALGTNFKA